MDEEDNKSLISVLNCEEGVSTENEIIQQFVSHNIVEVNSQSGELTPNNEMVTIMAQSDVPSTGDQGVNISLQHDEFCSNDSQMIQIVAQQDDISGELVGQQFIQLDNEDENIQFVQIVAENGETQYIQLTAENQEQILQLVGLASAVPSEQTFNEDGHILQTIEQPGQVSDGFPKQTEVMNMVNLTASDAIIGDMNSSGNGEDSDEQKPSSCSILLGAENSGDNNETKIEGQVSQEVQLVLGDDGINKKEEEDQKGVMTEPETSPTDVTQAPETYTSTLEPPIISIMPPRSSFLSQNTSTTVAVPSAITIPATSMATVNNSMFPESTVPVMTAATTAPSTIHVQIYNTNEEKESANVAKGPQKKTALNENKVPDLNSPITLTSETTVYVKGKKCVLRVDPSNNQLVAYPVKPEGSNIAKRPKGRPKKSKFDELADEEDLATTLADGGEVKDTTSEKESHALEGLLGLSDVGPDGRRKSLRTRKKPKVLIEEYEVGAIDGVDEETTEPVNPDDPRDKSVHINMAQVEVTEELDPQTGVLIRKEVIMEKPVKKRGGKINPTQNRIQNYLANLGLPVKRGRGRPRTNPSSDKSGPIPAFIIPSANGHAVMMAPVQGATAATVLGKRLPKLFPKPVSNNSEHTSVVGASSTVINTDTSAANTTFSSSGTITLVNTSSETAGTVTALPNSSASTMRLVESTVTSTPITVQYVDTLTGQIRSESLNEQETLGTSNEDVNTLVESTKNSNDSHLQVKRNTDGTLTVLYNNSNGELRTAIATPVTTPLSSAKPINIIKVPPAQESNAMKIIKLPPAITTIAPEPTESNAHEESIVLETVSEPMTNVDELEVDIEGGAIEDDDIDNEGIVEKYNTDDYKEEHTETFKTDREGITMVENTETANCNEENTQNEEAINITVSDEPLNVLSIPDDMSTITSQQEDAAASDFVMLDANDITSTSLPYSVEGILQSTTTSSYSLSSLDPPKQGILRVDIITPEMTQAVDSSEKENLDSVVDEKPVVPPAAFIQLPQQLVPLFMPTKEILPAKIGLRATEKQLDEYKCPKCGFQAYYERQYRDHIATHSEDEIQKCKCCQFVCFTNEELLSHFKENHPKCICPVCEHMAEHRYIIKRHMQRHNPEGSKCDVCGKTYKDQYILKMHIKMVHMPAEVLFECEVCQKKFTRKAHLKRHMRIHDPEKPFKCPHCDYRGCERSDITKHILIHEEPKYCCEVCGKSFRHIKNKELHLKRHRGQRDYKCGVCDFYGYTFTDIRKHIERKHADNRNILCHNCGTSFRNEGSLKEHRKICSEMLLVEPGMLMPNKFSSEPLDVADLSEDVNGSKQTVLTSRLLHDGGNRIMVEHVSLPEGVTVSLPEQSISSHVTMPGDMNESQIMDTSLTDMQNSVSDGGLIMVSQGGELIDTSNMEARVIDIDGEYIETCGVYGEEVDDDDGLGTHMHNGEDSMEISMQ